MRLCFLNVSFQSSNEIETPAPHPCQSSSSQRFHYRPTPRHTKRSSLAFVARLCAAPRAGQGCTEFVLTRRREWSSCRKTRDSTSPVLPVSGGVAWDAKRGVEVWGTHHPSDGRYIAYSRQVRRTSFADGDDVVWSVLYNSSLLATSLCCQTLHDQTQR